MKRRLLVPVVAPLVSVALLSFAAAASAADPVPASSTAQPAVAAPADPQIQFTAAELLSDLLDPAVVVTGEAQAQSTLPCIAFSFCQACPDGTAQLCFVVQCGTQKTKRCGDCVPDCMTFD